MGLKSQVKYPGFASYLRSHRERNYRSARDFCARVKIGISYPQYSRYEAGDQLPPLVQSITIFGQLGVSPLEALLEWNKAQLSDASVQAAPEPAVAKTLKEIEVLLNQVRSGISVEELSRALKIEPPVIREMLEDLERLGVVLRKDESFVAAKRNFYFPDDADFFELRNLNVRHNFSQLMDNLQFEALSTRQAFRGLITREFTPAQYRWVVDQSERLLAQAVGLPEDEGGDVIYSVMTVVGERFRRSQ